MTSERRREAGLVVYRAGTELVAKAAFFFVTVIAARRLSQDQFGLFSLGATVGWIAAVAADFGIQLHLARAVAQQPLAARSLLNAWLRIRVGTAIVAVLSVAIAAPLFANATHPASVLVLFTLVYAINGVVEFLYYFFRGLGRSDIESTMVVAQRVVLLVLATGVLTWRPGVRLLAVAMLVPAIGAVSLGLRLARGLARLESAGELPNAGRRLSADAVRDVLPIGGGIILSALYFRIDIFMIDAWQGAQAVALYNAVFRIVEALRLVPAAVLAVAAPTLFAATSRRPLVRVAGAMTGGAVVVSALLWLLSDRLVAVLYGDTYAVAAPAFRVLALSFPLMSLNYALTHQLIGWHGHRLYALLCAAALALNVGLNVVLIPAHGIVGAAWSTVFTEVLVTGACLVGLSLVSPDVARKPHGTAAMVTP